MNYPHLYIKAIRSYIFVHMLAIACQTAKLNGLTFFEGTWAEKNNFFIIKKKNSTGLTAREKRQKP